jgi:hypothetical protein
LAAIQLPYIRSAVDVLDSGRDYKQYPASDAGVWREFESQRFRDSLRGMGIRLFDAAHDPVGADSRNFIDPAHPTESGMLGTLLHLARNPDFRSLFPKLDTDQLTKDYAKAQADGNFTEIYRDRF